MTLATSQYNRNTVVVAVQMLLKTIASIPLGGNLPRHLVVDPLLLWHRVDGCTVSIRNVLFPDNE